MSGLCDIAAPLIREARAVQRMLIDSGRNSEAMKILNIIENITTRGAVPEALDYLRETVHAYRPPYQFPSMEEQQSFADKVRGLSAEQVAIKVAVLSLAKDKKTNSRAPYKDNIRKAWCAWSIALNSMGAPAPSFRRLRPNPHKTNKKAYFGWGRLLSNDKQVIDLHWIWLHHRHRISSKDSKWGQLFMSEEFDFVLASELVATLGSPAKKVNILGLTYSLQSELCMLHEPGIQKLHKTLRDSEKQAELALRNWADADRSRLDQERINDWLIVRKCLALTQGTPRAAAALYTLATGKTTSRQRMYKRRQQLEQYIKPALCPWKTCNTSDSPEETAA